MTSKRNINIRNLTDAIYSLLEKWASQEERSTEGQARHIINKAVQSFDAASKPPVENKRAQEVGERLRYMQAHVEPVFLPSELAEKIGEQHATFLEKCFAGQEEPSFAQLRAIALCYGINYAWLAHGRGTMYLYEHKRLPENPLSAATWLLETSQLPWPEDDVVDRIYFVRNHSEAGELAIVKKSRGGRWAIFRTPTHVSSEIGNDGEAMLVALFGTLRLMWKIYLGGYHDLPQTDVFSYILDNEDFDALHSGMHAPAHLMKPFKHSLWWEDIWDRSMVDKESEYWDGYQKIKKRILASEKLKRQEAKEAEMAETDISSHPLSNPEAPIEAPSSEVKDERHESDVQPQDAGSGPSESNPQDSLSS